MEGTKKKSAAKKNTAARKKFINAEASIKQTEAAVEAASVDKDTKLNNKKEII